MLEDGFIKQGLGNRDLYINLRVILILFSSTYFKDPYMRQMYSFFPTHSGPRFRPERVRWRASSSAAAAPPPPPEEEWVFASRRHLSEDAADCERDRAGSRGRFCKRPRSGRVSRRRTSSRTTLTASSTTTSLSGAETGTNSNS